MNAKEQYDLMIRLVEDRIQEKWDTDEIVDHLADAGLWEKRILAEIFKFMTGMSAVEYVKMRRMMHAYRVLLDGGDISQACDYSGLSNHSSFDKRFKQVFNMTPKDAKTLKKMGLYSGPMTWDAITTGNTTTWEVEPEMPNTPAMKFGINVEQLAKYNEVTELQSLYGFSDKDAVLAYDFAQDEKVSLKKAFKMISSAIEAYEIDTTDIERILGKEDEYREDDILHYTHTLHYILTYTNLPYPVADGLTISIYKDIIAIEDEDIKEVLLFWDYTNTFHNFNDFKETITYFASRMDMESDLDIFLEKIGEGMSNDDAFEAMKESIEKEKVREREEKIRAAIDDFCFDDSTDELVTEGINFVDILDPLYHEMISGKIDWNEDDEAP